MKYQSPHDGNRVLALRFSTGGFQLLLIEILGFNENLKVVEGMLGPRDGRKINCLRVAPLVGDSFAQSFCKTPSAGDKEAQTKKVIA